MSFKLVHSLMRYYTYVENGRWDVNKCNLLGKWQIKYLDPAFCNPIVRCFEISYLEWFIVNENAILIKMSSTKNVIV